MGTNFSQLKTNVGNRVNDTSTVFATIIGTYVNQRYKDILRRTNWRTIDDDFVVSGVSGTSSYSLPSDFGKELYVYDTVNKINLTPTTLEGWEQEYQSELKDSGTIEYYAIIDTADASARSKKIKFFRNLQADIDFDVPYILKPLDMSASTDVPCIDCERAIEYGATCDAWMYKRQFAKAQAYEQLYEKEIANLMFDLTNNTNLMNSMNPVALDRDMGI
jgi:hypothetical protein